MLGLVAWLLEVQVVGDDMLLVRRKQANLHIELSPTFLLDSERWVLEGYTRKRSTLAQVHHLNFAWLQMPVHGIPKGQRKASSTRRQK